MWSIVEIRGVCICNWQGACIHPEADAAVHTSARTVYRFFSARIATCEAKIESSGAGIARCSWRTSLSVAMSSREKSWSVQQCISEQENIYVAIKKFLQAHCMTIIHIYPKKCNIDRMKSSNHGNLYANTMANVRLLFHIRHNIRKIHNIGARRDRSKPWSSI